MYKRQVLIDGKDVTPYIRTPRISRGASDIAIIPELRLKLVDIQREVANTYDVVMDGRDIGTYVLPDADFKFFVTASPHERATVSYTHLGETLEVLSPYFENASFTVQFIYCLLYTSGV